MLFRKLLRTFGQYKAQFISMIIMIILGVGVFFGFNMEWYSLEKNLDYTMEQTGFADYRIYSEKGFTEADLAAVKAIDGVEDATRFLSVNTAVKDSDDTIAIAVTENSAISGVYLMDGEPYDEKSEDGIWLSDQYASQNGIAIGDELTLSYKLLSIKGTVRGLIKSGEFLVCVPDETQLMPDFNTYGFAYISPAMLNGVIPVMFRNRIGSLYYQINVKSGMEKAAFTQAVNQSLGKTLLIVSKAENLSYAQAKGEVEEGITMGSILPVLFLAIAILTMVTTMHRITASEKTQFGTLKALGFRNNTIMMHYSSYALMIGLVGGVFGIGLGYLLAWFIMNPNGAMGTYLDFPKWDLYVPPFCWAVLVLMIVFMVFIGYLSVRKILKGSAAETMRPYSPGKMKHLGVEETKTFKGLSFGTKWNLRDCLRHPARTGMTLFGIMGCMILLVGGLGMKDTMDTYIQSFYEDSIHYESRINLDTESIKDQEAREIAEKYHGDWSASAGVELGDKAVSLDVYHISEDHVRFLDSEQKLMRLTDGGAYICERIAKEFGLSIGDQFDFSPYGSNDTYSVVVRDVILSMTESIVMTDVYAESIGYEYIIDTIYTDAVDIEQNGHILNVQTKKAIMDSFDTFMELMNVMVFLLILSAIVLSLVVLYNLGIMSYTERYREMATLKVVGFKNEKIGKLLIGQNLWLSVIGILIGIPAGTIVLKYLVDALASEYEMKTFIGPRTYLVSVLLTFLVSLLVGVMIARKNRNIDMVAALKYE